MSLDFQNSMRGKRVLEQLKKSKLKLNFFDLFLITSYSIEVLHRVFVFVEVFPVLELELWLTAYLLEIHCYLYQ